MNLTYSLFIVCGFLAIVLACEGGYQLWQDRRSETVRRLRDRLRSISAGVRGEAGQALQKKRAELSPLERRLLALPRVRQLDRLMIQAGRPQPVLHFLAACGVGALCGALLGQLLGWPGTLVLVCATLGAVMPLLSLLRARQRRLRAFEQQLPEALDLMARALRAGHAFSGAIEMVGKEVAEPAGGEFRTTFDEINFGIPLPDALANLAVRVDSTDLRYFVIAVLLQRETGGNLAELLDNLSSLIRARFKLQGSIRVLSAEGRLSAWVLSLLPFVAAGVINLINPGFMSVLWREPAGIALVKVALLTALCGIFWMWRIVRIRV